ncbi:nudix -type motif 9 isoform a family protein [Cyclospora cayetanensis]|uniref:Nudix-type motif 9 isoform a family protein n=1 Tax=Cyclospora cayetanensis TaxID=88456 RepID=A0A1D3CRN9_9EIME|nr:nudix -type motif 9 isoform a family protein [Cyclospora cayetanensis]
MGEEEASMGSLKAGAALSEQDALCRERFPSSGLLYLRLRLLRRQLRLPRAPVESRMTQLEKEVLQASASSKATATPSLDACLAFLQEKGGKAAQAFSPEGLSALERSGRYSAILHCPYELWQGEARDAASCDAAAYFDWGSLLASLGSPLPSYMQPPQPADAKLLPSFTRVPDSVQAALGITKRQQTLSPPRSSPHLQRYTPVLDELGFPLSPLYLWSAAREKANISCSNTNTSSNTNSSSNTNTSSNTNSSGNTNTSSNTNSSSNTNTSSPLERSCRQDFIIALRGRGVLGAWGCNIAADAIVMRRHPETKRLQASLDVALVRRADGTDAYALPGGFVEEGELENLSQCAAREFLEEAAAYSLSTSSPAAGAEDAADGEDEAAESAASRSGRLDAAEETNVHRSIEALKSLFGNFRVFKDGNLEFTSPPAKKPPLCVYAGLVDDERNTANAWMETAAFLWVLDEAQSENIFLQAGSDAAEGSAAFYDLEEDSELAKRGVKPLENLFGSHSAMLRHALRFL